MNVVPAPNRDSLHGSPEAWNRLMIHDLKVVLAVSQAGGIRKASIDLGIGQPAVTRRVQKLEDALGVSLFDRSQIGVRLTAAGWDFSGQVRRILKDLNAAIASAQAAGEATNGCLRIGLIASLSQGLLREVVPLTSHCMKEVGLEAVQFQALFGRDRIAARGSELIQGNGVRRRA
jgi:DNA-binding transcriptional LysR family regulator